MYCSDIIGASYYFNSLPAEMNDVISGGIKIYLYSILDITWFGFVRDYRLN